MTNLKQTQTLEIKAMMEIVTSSYEKATAIFRPLCFPGNSTLTFSVFFLSFIYSCFIISCVPFSNK